MSLAPGSVPSIGHLADHGCETPARWLATPPLEP